MGVGAVVWLALHAVHMQAAAAATTNVVPAPGCAGRVGGGASAAFAPLTLAADHARGAAVARRWDDAARAGLAGPASCGRRNWALRGVPLGICSTVCGGAACVRASAAPRAARGAARLPQTVLRMSGTGRRSADSDGESDSAAAPCAHVMRTCMRACVLAGVCVCGWVGGWVWVCMRAPARMGVHDANACARLRANVCARTQMRAETTPVPRRPFPVDKTLGTRQTTAIRAMVRARSFSPRPGRPRTERCT